jgi:hypothetical protein
MPREKGKERLNLLLPNHFAGPVASTTDNSVGSFVVPCSAGAVAVVASKDATPCAPRLGTITRPLLDSITSIGRSCKSCRDCSKDYQQILARCSRIYGTDADFL